MTQFDHSTSTTDLFLYAGGLARFHSGEWRLRAPKRGPEPAIDTPSCDESVERMGFDEIHSAVVTWRAGLVATLKGDLGIHVDWDESREAPVFTDRFVWSAYGALLLWAAYHDSEAVEPPATVPAEWWLDPVFIQWSSDDSGTSYPSLLSRADVWLPGEFFPFRCQFITGAATVFASLGGLFGDLMRLNTARWGAKPAEVEAWIDFDASPGSPLERAAKAGFSRLLDVMLRAEEHSVPMRLAVVERPPAEVGHRIEAGMPEASSPEAFTELVRARLEASPEVAFTEFVAPLVVDVHSVLLPDRSPARLGMNELWNKVQGRSAAAIEEAIAIFVARIPSPVPANDTGLGFFGKIFGARRKKKTEERIVPIIRSRAYVEDFNHLYREQGGLVEEPLVGDLHVVYARDHEKLIEPLSRAELSESAMSMAELRAVAIRNLSALVDDGIVVHKGHFDMLTCGGDYEPSLLLLDELWDAQEGPVVAAVPSRDVIVFAKDAVDQKSTLRGVAEHMRLNADHPVSTVLLARADGGWKVAEA